jgi:hypothetical protein
MKAKDDGQYLNSSFILKKIRCFMQLWDKTNMEEVCNTEQQWHFSESSTGSDLGLNIAYFPRRRLIF